MYLILLKISFCFFNQQFSFSAKNEYKLAAERRATARREANKSLKNPDWRKERDSNPRGLLTHLLSKQAP